MQEHHRCRLNALRSKLAANRAGRIFIERRQHCAVVADPFGHFEDPVARHEWKVLAEEQVERIGPVDTPDLVDVAKTLGRYERGSRTLTFENRVDRHGRTVNDELSRCGRGARYSDRIEDAGDQIVRRGERLAEAHQTRRSIENRRVGERSANVDADPQPAHFLGL